MLWLSSFFFPIYTRSALYPSVILDSWKERDVLGRYLFNVYFMIYEDVIRLP